MALPFLEPRKMSAMIIARRGKPDLEANPEVEAPGHEIDPELKSASEKIMRAFHEKSIVDLANGLQDFIYACDAAPHEDGDQEDQEGNE